MSVQGLGARGEGAGYERGPNPVTRGDSPLSLYSWAPDERTEIQTDPVTPAFVGCVCVCVCVCARAHACTCVFTGVWLASQNHPFPGLKSRWGESVVLFITLKRRPQQPPHALCPPTPSCSLKRRTPLLAYKIAGLSRVVSQPVAQVSPGNLSETHILRS